MGKFSVQWINDPTDHRRDMTQHTVMLRRGHATPQGYPGLSCKELYLDQVYILFRPSDQINPAEFVAPDSADFNWHVETDQLMVETNPGFHYPLYSVGGNTPDYIQTAHNPTSLCNYGCALTVTPGSQGEEDYWCRTYRPVRDVPLAVNLHDINQMEIRLCFPLLLGHVMRQVPNYRILRVLCEFTTKDD